jgi:hypothetical protein
MFVLTANIKFIDGGRETKPLQPHKVSWSRKIDSYCDSAKIVLPSQVMLKNEIDAVYQKVETGVVLKEGMKVEISCGYDGVNDLRFKGFIRRRNLGTPLELECEGYSYQLQLKQGYTKSYSQVTIKQLLTDLVEGTDIKLSELIPDVSLKNIYFKNSRGTDVLEYLKDKCLLTVNFDLDVLYAGLEQLQVKSAIDFRLNWNVIKDSGLKFETNKELATVNIQIENRDKTGVKKKGNSQVKDGAVKKIGVRHITDEAALSKIAEEARKKATQAGYQGAITAFLQPYAEPGMSAKISDTRYPERTGTYFIESVEGEFGPGGGRQKIKIGRSL